MAGNGRSTKPRDIPCTKKVQVCVSTSTSRNGISDIINLEHKSNIHKLLRVTSYVLRLVTNLKQKINKEPVIESDLKKDELETAKKMWIVNEQCKMVADKDLMTKLSRTLGIYLSPTRPP